MYTDFFLPGSMEHRFGFFFSFPPKKIIKKNLVARLFFSLLYRTATGGGVAWHHFINAGAMAFMIFSCILRASAIFFSECLELA